MKLTEKRRKKKFLLINGKIEFNQDDIYNELHQKDICDKIKKLFIYKQQLGQFFFVTTYIIFQNHMLSEFVAEQF